jgi:hypothetical protein
MEQRKPLEASAPTAAEGTAGTAALSALRTTLHRTRFNHSFGRPGQAALTHPAAFLLKNSSNRRHLPYISPIRLGPSSDQTDLFIQ